VGQLAEGDAGDDARPAGLAYRLSVETAGDHREQVADEQVLEGQESVQRPHVHVLTAIPEVPPLGWRQASKWKQGDVRVEAGDVGVAVVQRVVLDPP
jgi:hypothetical protein